MKRSKRSKSTKRGPAASLSNTAHAAGDRPSLPSIGSIRPVWALALAATLIVLATTIAYSNSLYCPFIFDDDNDIVHNASIRHLWPLRDIFVASYDGQSVLRSRPVVNFSLALNHAIGRTEPLAYHVTNLLVHVLAGLALFGIVRRTLLLPSMGGRFAAAATALALAAALVWILHPLQTGAVTYVTQRYESMMGLFYLLALYAAIRCGTSAYPRGWAVTAVAASLLALGCKEVAVSIPIVILLYDRAFMAGSFREAWRRRWGMYLGLAASWAPFAVLQASSPGRNTWAGYSLPVTWIEYAQSQFGVILHYLRLSVWPCPLVLDYGWPVARTARDIVPGAIVICGLAAATVYALIRWPKWGFLGAWFFLILAPTSSVLPIRDLAFEHRMYLPLAAVTVAVVVGVWHAGRWFVGRGALSLRASQFLGGLLVLCAGLTLGVLTFQRNLDYESALSLWRDTVAKAPLNARVYLNLGNALADRQQSDEAITSYKKALALNPDYAEAHYNLGLALAGRRQMNEAVAEYDKALALNPVYVDAHINLGAALASQGRVVEALAHCQKAVEINPNSAEAHNNLGNALAMSRKVDQALPHFQKAVEIDPDYAEAHNNLGVVLAGCGRADEAIAHYQAALQLRPDYADAHNNLGLTLGRRGRIDEAVAHFRRALEINPDLAAARKNLAAALGKQQKAD
jgi:tetratricopeptide (TPR) repeat protein